MSARRVRQFIAGHELRDITKTSKATKLTKAITK
jgi:hypothetical protein